MKFPKQSEYPKQVYVRSEAYKIVFTKRIKHCGDTDSGTKVIRLKAGMSPRETFSTLIHEMLHAIEFECEIDIKHKAIYALEQGIFNLLVDNFL